MSLVYPTFSPFDADSALDRIEALVAGGEDVRPFPDGVMHPRTEYRGLGNAVQKSRLEALHDRLAGELDGGVSARGRAGDRQFDITAGRVLDSWFASDGRDQAARPEIWSYLAIIVLPDIAIRRFGPDAHGRLPRARFLPGRRNVFYRSYLRASLFGQLLDDPDLPIYEDELVGLVDRNFSADRRLVQAVASVIRRVPAGAGRRTAVREGLKGLQFERRVTDLGALTDEELYAMIARLVQEERDRSR